MSKFSGFRKNFWRNTAARSFKRAADGKSSRTWTSIGVVASIFHIMSRTQAKKKRVLWRGRIHTGETLRISQNSDQHVTVARKS